MSTLTIRDLDPEVKARLRVRAAKRGRSMEAEARAILAAAVTSDVPATGLGDYVRAMVKGHEADLPLPARMGTATGADLG